MKVIYLDIDSLRPDHLGCYGYGRPTSPNLDRIAREGMRFTECHTSDSPCMPSRAAYISGSFGRRNGVVTHGNNALVLDPTMPTLPAILRKQNIRTAAFSTFGRHPSPWFYGEWEEFHDPKGWKFQQTPAWKINDLVLPWLDEHFKEDFYIHVQYWDPHSVYEAPEGCVKAVQNAKYPALPTPEMVEKNASDRFYHSGPYVGIENYEGYKRMIDEYDAEIRYVDYHIGVILRKLEDLGILDDTLIIVAADHGEGLGEHGLYVEHWSTHVTTNWIPLIVRYPAKVPKESVSNSLVYHFDIAATVLDAFGIETPSVWDSKSLFSHVNENNDIDREFLVIGHGLYTVQRSVVTRKWKMIRTLNSGVWNYPPVQLFDREHDFYEQHNVAERNPEVVRLLDGYLSEWESRSVPYKGIDPATKVAYDGPPGFDLYSHPTIDDFWESGTPDDLVFAVRKPEIPLD